jgi:hypothetical protein
MTGKGLKIVFDSLLIVYPCDLRDNEEDDKLLHYAKRRPTNIFAIKKINYLIIEG